MVTLLLSGFALYQTFLKDSRKKHSVADELIALRLQDLQDIKTRLSVLEERTKHMGKGSAA